MSIVNITPTSPNVFVNTNSNTKVVLLPSANASVGKIFTIKDFTGNARQIPFFISTTAASDLIDRTNSSIRLRNPSEVIRIQSLGTNQWSVLGRKDNFINIKNTKVFSGETEKLGSGIQVLNPTRTPTVTASGGSEISVIIDNGNARLTPVTSQSLLFYTTLLDGSIVSSNSTNLFSTTTFSTNGSNNLTTPLTFNTSYYLVAQTSNLYNDVFSSNAIRAGPYLFGDIPLTASNITINTSDSNITAFWSSPTSTFARPLSSFSVELFSNPLSNLWSNANSFGSIVTGLGVGRVSTLFSAPTFSHYYGAKVYTINAIGSNVASNTSMQRYGDAPLPPSNITYTSTLSNFTVSWTPPEFSRSRPLHSYGIQYVVGSNFPYLMYNTQAFGSIISIPSTITSNVFQFPVNGTYYGAQVYSSNTVGAAGNSIPTLLLFGSPPQASVQVYSVSSQYPYELTRDTSTQKTFTFSFQNSDQNNPNSQFFGIDLGSPITSNKTLSVFLGVLNNDSLNIMNIYLFPSGNRFSTDSISGIPLYISFNPQYAMSGSQSYNPTINSGTVSMYFRIQGYSVFTRKQITFSVTIPS